MSSNITYPEILFYYGEFGYFNMFILPHLEYIFTKIKTDSVIVLSTLKDYADILEIKFPSNIIFIDTKKYSRYRIRFSNIEFDKCSYQPISEYLRKMIPEFENRFEKLMTSSLDETNMKSFLKIEGKEKISEKYISIFPRSRSDFSGIHTENRNVDKVIWMVVIDYLTKKYKGVKIISHGHKNEKLKLDNVTESNNIIESIKYLNNSFLFISPDSGFVAFSKNCGVKNNIVLSHTMVQEFVPYFSPFKNITRIINFVDSKTIENDLNKILSDLRILE